ncbi:hypothetical protein DITRI_Ditri06bG0075600 [Diplodiscus trichospermus]
MADGGVSTLTQKESGQRKEKVEKNPRTDAADADQQQPKIDTLNIITDAKPVSWKHPPDSGDNSIYRDAHWWYGLPRGWIVEERPRTAEKYIGKSDQYYYEPGTNRQFRSFKAVQRQLQVTGQLENNVKLAPPPSGQEENGEPPTGQNDQQKAMIGGDEPEASQSSGSHSTIKVRRKRIISIINFDFPSPPEKVTWEIEAYDSVIDEKNQAPMLL